jgi:methyl-accepting chemotaxis protein
MANTTKAAANKVEALVDDAQTAANDQVEKMTKSFEGVAAFGQEMSMQLSNLRTWLLKPPKS